MLVWLLGMKSNYDSFVLSILLAIKSISVTYVN